MVLRTSAVTPNRVIAVSVALFALSLPLPALWEGIGAQPVIERGHDVLTAGWVGAIMLQFGWFANPVWVAAIVYLWRRRWKDAAVIACIAVGFAANSFLLPLTGLPSDGGVSHPVRLLIGFYVWWASLCILAAGALLLLRRHRSDETEARSG